MHWPGIEPGPPAWQARILPLNHQCKHDRMCVNIYSVNVPYVYVDLRFGFDSFLSKLWLALTSGGVQENLALATGSESVAIELEVPFFFFFFFLATARTLIRSLATNIRQFHIFMFPCTKSLIPFFALPWAFRITLSVELFVLGCFLRLFLHGMRKRIFDEPVCKVCLKKNLRKVGKTKTIEWFVRQIFEKSWSGLPEIVQHRSYATEQARQESPLFPAALQSKELFFFVYFPCKEGKTLA